MRKTQNKSGFSIMEVVIALAIAVIVTITALSIVLSSIATTTNAIHKSQAQNFADNAWESFKAAKSQEEFLEFLSFAEGVTLTSVATDDHGNTVYTCYFENHPYTAVITVGFPADAPAEFAITVTDTKEIISFSYRKGAGR